MFGWLRLPFLRRDLRDSNPVVRARAARALATVGRAAVPLLIDALEDRSPQVLLAAINSLGTIGDEEAREPLLTVVSSKRYNAGVQQAAWRSLLRIDEDFALKKLARHLMKCESNAVAAAILREQGWEPGTPEKQVAFALALQDPKMAAAAGEAGLASLCAAFKKYRHVGGEQTRAITAAKALGLLGLRRAVPVLLEGLREGDFSLADACAGALHHIPDIRALKPLIEKAAQADKRSTSSARSALNPLAAKHRPQAELLEVLHTGSNPEKRIALELLAAGASAEAARELLPFLKHPDADVHAAAAAALTAWHYTPATPEERIALANASGQFLFSPADGIDPATPLLEALAADCPAATVRGIVAALSPADQKRVLESLLARAFFPDRGNPQKGVSPLALYTEGARGLPPGRPQRVRLEAIEALLWLGNLEAVDKLKARVGRADVHPVEQVAAAKTLAGLGHGTELRGLLRGDGPTTAAERAFKELLCHHAGTLPIDIVRWLAGLTRVSCQREGEEGIETDEYDLKALSEMARAELNRRG